MNYDDIKLEIDPIAAADDPIAVLRRCFPDPKADFRAGPLPDWIAYILANNPPEVAFDVVAPYIMTLLQEPVAWPNGPHGQPLPGLLLRNVSKRSDRDPRWGDVALDVQLAFDKPVTWTWEVMQGLPLDPDKVDAGLAKEPPPIWLVRWLADHKDARCRAPLVARLSAEVEAKERLHMLVACCTWLLDVGDDDIEVIEEAIGLGMHFRDSEGKLDHDQAESMIALIEKRGGFLSAANHEAATAGLHKVKLSNVYAPARARKALQARLALLAPT